MTLHEIFTIILLSIACYLAVILVIGAVVFPLIAYSQGSDEAMREILQLIRKPMGVVGIVWGVDILILTLMGI